MKTFVLILLIFSSFQNCYGQSKSLFDINVFTYTDSSVIKKFNDYKKLNAPFYEDEKYIVSKTCSGEWGGTIKFKNKNTGIEYAHSATCPVSVNKINGKYIVTNNQEHGSGSSNILEIENPDTMDVYKPSFTRKIVNGELEKGFVFENECFCYKGGIKLLDSSGVETYTSFLFKRQLIHIISNNAQLFVAKIENAKYKIIDTIYDSNNWLGYYTEAIKLSKDHIIIRMNQDDVQDYLEINKNKINFYHKINF